MRRRDMVIGDHYAVKTPPSVQHLGGMSLYGCEDLLLKGQLLYLPEEGRSAEMKLSVPDAIELSENATRHQAESIGTRYVLGPWKEHEETSLFQWKAMLVEKEESAKNHENKAQAKTDMLAPIIAGVDQTEPRGGFHSMSYTYDEWQQLSNYISGLISRVQYMEYELAKAETEVRTLK